MLKDIVRFQHQNKLYEKNGFDRGCTEPEVPLIMATQVGYFLRTTNRQQKSMV